jgi:hypothetical protein
MIVLSVGMPRAGSGWHYNMVHDLMQTAGGVETKRIRQQFRLEGILTEVNCNIGVLSTRRLAMVLRPAILGNTFVIKAHAAPSGASRLLSAIGMLRAAYIYRDPRDAMLSAFEYGQRALANGRPNAFSHLTDFQASLNFMLPYVRIWEKWASDKKVHSMRYEELLVDYTTVAAGLVRFLGLDGEAPAVRLVLDKYRPQAAEGQTGLHFNKGQIGRFRGAYTPAQQEQVQAAFGTFLERMGYEI